MTVIVRNPKGGGFDARGKKLKVSWHVGQLTEDPFSFTFSRQGYASKKDLLSSYPGLSRSPVVNELGYAISGYP